MLGLSPSSFVTIDNMKLNTHGFSALIVVIAIVLLGVLGFGGYKVYQVTRATNQGQSETTAAKTEEPAEPEVTAPSGTVITTGDSEFGPMLFDEKGQAIYIWQPEETTTAECYDDCAMAWPPVVTNGAPQASGAAKSDLLGTTQRRDGTTQVTYGGHPLYYYAHEAPGEVKCHNISTHGGLWWVIQPDGNRAA